MAEPDKQQLKGLAELINENYMPRLIPATKEAQKESAVRGQAQVSQIGDVISMLLFGSEPGSKHGPSAGLLSMLAAPPGVVKAYRDWRKSLAKMPSGKFDDLPKSAQAYIERLVKGVSWHGTQDPDQLLRTGKFDSEKVGSNLGLRFGEPSGVSVSSDPQTAGLFGGGSAVRSTVVLSPSTIVPVFSKRGYESILDAYRRTANETETSPFQLMNPSFISTTSGPSTSKMSFAEAMQDVKKSIVKKYGSFQPEYISDALTSKGIKIFNDALSKNLRRKEIEGLIYNPNRYNEFETRILNPKNVIPLERRITDKSWKLPGERDRDIPERYLDLMRDIKDEFSAITRHYPTSLSEYYRKDPYLLAPIIEAGK